MDYLGLHINPYIFYGIGIGLVLQLFAIYMLSDIFHTLPLNAESLKMICFLALWVFGMIEIRKWVEYLWKKEVKEEVYHVITKLRQAEKVIGCISICSIIV